MKIVNVSDFNHVAIVDLVNKMRFSGEHSYTESAEWFDFRFSNILIQIWISHAFYYQKKGVVKDLPDSIRGIMTSKIAALGGIESIFLNRHSGGASNSKEAEMRKLAKKHYKTGSLGDVMVIDNPERELEFFFSMMDYLGFSYAGV